MAPLSAPRSTAAAGLSLFQIERASRHRPSGSRRQCQRPFAAIETGAPPARGVSERVPCQESTAPSSSMRRSSSVAVTFVANAAIRRSCHARRARASSAGSSGAIVT